jgi:hypothetical protein
LPWKFFGEIRNGNLRVPAALFLTITVAQSWFDYKTVGQGRQREEKESGE